MSDINYEREDIFWRNDRTGQTYIWQIDSSGLGIEAEGSLGTKDLDWRIKDFGRFNKNKRQDVLWQNVLTGEVEVWLIDNGAVLDTSGSPGTISSRNWHVHGIGDFNNDAREDILFQNKTTGEIRIWLLNGVNLDSAGTPGTIQNPDMRIKHITDLDGDGDVDVLFQNRTSGSVAVWVMNGTTISSIGSPGKINNPLILMKGIGDYDNDGDSDILWRKSSTGNVFNWLMNGATKTGTGSPGAVLNSDIKIE